MIFLGAGASQPFDILTSVSLTNILLKTLTRENPKLVEDIKYFLKTYNKTVDFENILTILNILTDPNSIRGDHYAHNFRIGYGHIGDYSRYVNKMYDIVYDKCTDPFNIESENYLDNYKIEEIYKLTYDPLIGYPSSSRRGEIIFSTNYDPSIEIWCHKRNLLCYDGRIGTHNPEFCNLVESAKLVQLLRDNRDANIALQRNVPLIRLHGSVLSFEKDSKSLIKFNQIRENLTHKDLYMNIMNKRPQLIFPGQEELLGRGQWDILYQYFKESLFGDCLFIGYSFRHEILNTPIIDNLRNDSIKKLGIFVPDPDKNLENLFRGKDIPEEKIVRIKGKFGTKQGLKLFCERWVDSSIPFSIQIVEIDQWVQSRNDTYP